MTGQLILSGIQKPVTGSGCCDQSKLTASKSSSISVTVGMVAYIATGKSRVYRYFPFPEVAAEEARLIEPDLCLLVNSTLFLGWCRHKQQKGSLQTAVEVVLESGRLNRPFPTRIPGTPWGEGSSPSALQRQAATLEFGWFGWLPKSNHEHTSYSWHIQLL